MKNLRNPFWIAVIVLACLILCLPLLRAGFFISDDGEWMVIRLSAFYQSLSQGQFPVRWLNRLNHSYGYPVANFLYPGYLYIGSLLHSVGFSYVTTIKIILFGSVCGTALVLYLSLRKFFTTTASFLGTMSFVGFPYVAYDIFRRGSVGEVLAMFPSSLLMHSYIYGNWYLIPPIIAFLIVSHNSIALLFLSMFIVFVWMNGKLNRVLLPVTMGIGMATFFWMPAILEQRFVKFGSIVISDPKDYFITSSNIYLLGIPSVVAIFLVFLQRKKIQKFFWSIIIILFICYVFVLPVSYQFWRIPMFMSLVQFPFRFLFFPAILGPWIVALLWSMSTVKNRYMYAIFFGLIWAAGVFQVQKQIVFVDRSEGYYSTNEDTTTVHDEYMPKWVGKHPTMRAVNNIELVAGDATIINRTNQTQSLDVTIDAKVESMVQVNKIFYPGWGVTIDGARVPISYENLGGVIQFKVPKGEHRVVAQFRETISRFVADLISLIFVVLYIISLRYLKRRT